MKQRLTENLQGLIATEAIVTSKIDFEKKEWSCSMIKKIEILLSDQIFASYLHQ